MTFSISNPQISTTTFNPSSLSPEALTVMNDTCRDANVIRALVPLRPPKTSMNNLSNCIKALVRCWEVYGKFQYLFKTGEGKEYSPEALQRMETFQAVNLGYRSVRPEIEFHSNYLPQNPKTRLEMFTRVFKTLRLVIPSIPQQQGQWYSCTRRNDLDINYIQSSSKEWADATYCKDRENLMIYSGKLHALETVNKGPLEHEYRSEEHWFYAKNTPGSEGLLYGRKLTAVKHTRCVLQSSRFINQISGHFNAKNRPAHFELKLEKFETIYVGVTLDCGSKHFSVNLMMTGLIGSSHQHIPGTQINLSYKGLGILEQTNVTILSDQEDKMKNGPKSEL